MRFISPTVSENYNIITLNLMLKDRHDFSVTQETRAKSDVYRRKFCLESSASLFILQFDICSIKKFPFENRIEPEMQFQILTRALDQ